SKPQAFQPVVLKNERNREFRWKGKLFVQGLFDGEHYFQLNRISDNETEFIHGENFSGVFVGPIMSMIGDKTKAGFIAMNQALKNRVEQSN
ncbi:MAG: SRPBCC domain-containing protein, partial [Flavobacteriales bacterium]